MNDIRPRVLLAGTAEAIKKLRALLADEAQIVAAQSIDEALRHIDPDIALIICNVRFDDSRMFDFLHAVNARLGVRCPPVICCRLSQPPFSLGVRAAIRMAAQALGVSEFVDYYKLQEERGAEGAREKLREIVMAHLPRVTGA